MEKEALSIIYGYFEEDVSCSKSLPNGESSQCTCEMHLFAEHIQNERILLAIQQIQNEIIYLFMKSIKDERICSFIQHIQNEPVPLLRKIVDIITFNVPLSLLKIRDVSILPFMKKIYTEPEILHSIFYYDNDVLFEYILLNTDPSIFGPVIHPCKYINKSPVSKRCFRLFRRHENKIRKENDLLNRQRVDDLLSKEEIDYLLHEQIIGDLLSRPRVDDLLSKPCLDIANKHPAEALELIKGYWENIDDTAGSLACLIYQNINWNRYNWKYARRTMYYLLQFPSLFQCSRYEQMTIIMACSTVTKFWNRLTKVHAIGSYYDLFDDCDVCGNTLDQWRRLNIYSQLLVHCKDNENAINERLVGIIPKEYIELLIGSPKRIFDCSRLGDIPESLMD